VLAETIYGRLRSALMRAELVPHQRLKVRDLAHQMGTSETPVREALVQLAREGALEVRPRFFIRVPRLTAAEYRDIRDIRLELEPLAAERAMFRVDAHAIDRLEAVHERLVAAEAQGDWRAALDANKDFHFGLFDHAGMPPLIQVLEGLWARVGPMLSELYPSAPPAYPDGHQHLSILDALRRRDPYALRLAMRLDLIEGGRNLLRRIGEQERHASERPTLSGRNGIETRSIHDHGERPFPLS